MVRLPADQRPVNVAVRCSANDAIPSAASAVPNSVIGGIAVIATAVGRCQGGTHAQWREVLGYRGGQRHGAGHRSSAVGRDLLDEAFRNASTASNSSPVRTHRIALPRPASRQNRSVAPPNG